MAITLLPVPCPRVVHRPYMWLAALQIADVVTTWWILHSWAVRAEGNPFIAWMLNTVGLPAGMIILLVFKLGMVYLLWTCQTGTKIALSVYTVVIFNNLLFLVLWINS